MDHGPWKWRRRSSSKTATENITPSAKGDGDERIPKTEMLELEKSVKSLNELLSSALVDCNAKDTLLSEVYAEKATAEAELSSYKKKLENALKEREIAEGRINQLDCSVKDITKELDFLRDDQEKRIRDAALKNSKDYYDARAILERKLAESDCKIDALSTENYKLTEIIQSKETLIEELIKKNSQIKDDYGKLMGRLETVENDNTSFRYEICMLGKELEIRNQERDFYLKSSDSSHKQFLESVKKITQLEAECQKLRVLVRKRLPGPAALAKMRQEVEILEGDSVQMNGFRRQKGVTENVNSESNKRIKTLVQKLCEMEEENRTLRETLSRKNIELESLIEEHDNLTEDHIGIDPQRNSAIFCDETIASNRHDDEISCSGSWASALISELDHFRNGKSIKSPCKVLGAADLSLMDDFAEVERSTIITMSKSPESSLLSSDENHTCLTPLTTGSRLGKEPVGLKYECNEEKNLNWIENIVTTILQCHRSTGKGLDEIIDDIKQALRSSSSISGEISDCGKISSNSRSFDPSKVNSESKTETNESISKVIKLIEEIKTLSMIEYDYENTRSNDENCTLHSTTNILPYYTVRAFQWKTSELCNVLEDFIGACNDLLNKKTNVENFIKELTIALEWIMGHCFSIRDVSNMKDSIKNQFDWDESCSVSEAGMNSPTLEVEKNQLSEESKSKIGKSPLTSSNAVISNGYAVLPRIDEHCEKDESREIEEVMNIMKPSKCDIREKNLPWKELLPMEIKDTTLQMMILQEDKKETVEVTEPELSSCKLESEEKKCCNEQVVREQDEEYFHENQEEEERKIKTNKELQAASEKLAECQEAILNLGKQLRAISSSPQNTAFIDKTISTPSAVNHQLSSFHRNESSEKKKNGIIEQSSLSLDYNEMNTSNPNNRKQSAEILVSSSFKHLTRQNSSRSLTLVPKRTHSGAFRFFKKLLLRKKRGGSKRFNSSSFRELL